jgi:diadenosine tetraphosphatase ApaH/serine/threonine PP2A family protein phosphatase
MPTAKQRLREVLEQCARVVTSAGPPPSPSAPPPDPAARARARKLARRRQLEQLGVGLTPRMLERLAAEQLPSSLPLDAVREWYDDPDRRRVLVLCASVGSGKTVAGAALALEHTASLWATPRALLQAHGTLYGDEGARWQRLAQAPLLIVDGLGGEETRHHAQVSLALRELLEARSARDTLITSYVSRGQLKTTYAHGALGSLLDELALQLTVAGPDLRGKP